MPRILFIDDYYEDFEAGLKERFGPSNVLPQITPNFKEIRKKIGDPDNPEIDLVLLDVMFEYDENGNPCLAKDYGGYLLERIKNEYDIPVLMLTTTARETSSNYSAEGVISKPTDTSDERFYEMLWNEASYWVDVSKADWDKRFGIIIGNNPEMTKTARKIVRFAKYRIARIILVTGETGTGKEEICKALHKEFGFRSDNNSYQVIHCGHFDPRDFRIRLGGFPKQPHADAVTGVLEILEKLNWQGTLVIDEVDDLNIDSQNVLNRILEGYPFQQENNPKRVFSPGPDCRFIFTAQRDLQQLVKERKVRDDLWARINTNHIHLPPFRERKEDVPKLFKFYVQKIAPPGFDPFLRPDVEEKLESYHYPDNIRGFKNIIARAISFSSNSPLRPEDILFTEETEPVTSFLSPEYAVRKILQKELSYTDVLNTYRRDSKEMRDIIEKLINEITKDSKEISQEILADYLQTNINNVKQLLAKKKDKKTGKVILEKISLVEKKVLIKSHRKSD